MIRITRPANPPLPLDLASPNSAASRERKKILDHIDAHGVPPKGKNTFTAYKNTAIRDALRDLFHNKCAYCESRIAGAYDGDVEHYRPKGKVTDAEKAGVTHPGYWWLGMRWENLVLGCAHCNQTRHQIIFQDGMSEAEARALIEAGVTLLVGKLDAFPTEDSKWVVRHTDDVATEKPLLLDPTSVDPMAHLEWVVNGDLSTVRPRNGSLVGRTSIDIFGLNRRRLTEDRMYHLRSLKRRGNEVVRLLNEATAAPDDAVADAHQAAALGQIELLKQDCADDQPFAALARAYVADLIRTIDGMR